MMLGKLVEYKGKIKLKVDSYNEMPQESKSGSFWDSSDDKELKEVKKFIKDHYIKVQDYTCPYCRQRIEVEHNATWDAEHIIPKDKYPNFLFSPSNLCVSCKDCNQEKWNKNVLRNQKRTTLPVNSIDYTFIHPNIDEYEKHMKVLSSSLFFIPLDSKGKETIEICGLLRFLYKFTEYGDVSIEISKQINRFSSDLMNTECAAEQHIILACIGDLVEHGKKLAKKEYLEK